MVTWLSSMIISASRRQVVDQRRRRLARLASGQVARVVLDALAEAQLVQHLEVEARALLDALRLDQLALALEELDALAQLDLDRLDRPQRRRRAASRSGSTDRR